MPSNVVLNSVLRDATGPAFHRLNNRIEGISRSTYRLNRNLDKVGARARAFGAITTAAIAATTAIFALGAAFFGLNTAVQTASNIVEAVNLVGITFGEGAARVREYARTAVAELGQVESETLQFIGELGANLKDAFPDKTRRLDVTLELATRVSDIASAVNKPIAEVQQRIRSVLAGESEAGRRIHVFASEERVKEYLKLLGILPELSRTFSDAQKQVGRVAIIMEDTEQFVGDFANTADELANTQRILHAQWVQIQATVGEGLIPLWLAMGLTLKNNVMPRLLEVSTTLRDNLARAIIFTVIPAAKVFGREWNRVWGMVWDKLKEIYVYRVSPTLDRLAQTLKRFSKDVAVFIGFNTNAWQSAWDFMKMLADRYVADIIAQVQKLRDELGFVPDDLNLADEPSGGDPVDRNTTSSGVNDPGPPLLTPWVTFRQSLLELLDGLFIGSIPNIIRKGITAAIAAMVKAVVELGAEFRKAWRKNWRKSVITALRTSRAELIAGLRWIFSTLDLGGLTGKLIAQLANIFGGLRIRGLASFGEAIRDVSRSFWLFINTTTELELRLGRVYWAAKTFVRALVLGSWEVRNSYRGVVKLADVVGGALGRVFRAVLNWNPLLLRLGKRIVTIISGWGVGVGRAVLSWAGHFGTLGVRVVDKITEWAPSVGKAAGRVGVFMLTAIKTATLGFGKTLFNITKPLVSGAFSKIFGVVVTWGGRLLKVLGIVGWIVDAIRLLIVAWDDFVQLSINASEGDWASAWNNIRDIGFHALDLLRQDVEQIGALIIDGVNNIMGTDYSVDWNTTWDTISEKIRTTWDTILVLIQPGRDLMDITLPVVLENLKTVWQTTWDNIADRLTRFKERYDDDLAPTVEALQAGFSGFSTFALGVLVPALVTVGSIFITAVGLAIEMVINHVELILTTLSGLIMFLQGVFTADWDLAWAGIKTILEGVKTFVEETITTILNFINGIFLTFGVDLRAPWENFWSFMKDTLYTFKDDAISAINEVIDAINGFIDSISNKRLRTPSFGTSFSILGNTIDIRVPSIDLFTTPDFSNIPRLGEGGIVHKPTLAIVGEEGPEVISPLKNFRGGATFVFNNYAPINGVNDLERTINTGLRYGSVYV